MSQPFARPGLFDYNSQVQDLVVKHLRPEPVVDWV